MSKSFQVPPPVVVTPWKASDPSTPPEVVAFLEFAENVWLDDVRACANLQGQSSLVQQNRWYGVIDKFEGTKVGDWVTLDDQDYAVLRRIVEAPARAYKGMRTMRACLPFSEAVLGAVDKIPAALTAAETAQA